MAYESARPMKPAPAAVAAEEAAAEEAAAEAEVAEVAAWCDGDGDDESERSAMAKPTTQPTTQTPRASIVNESQRLVAFALKLAVSERVTARRLRASWWRWRRIARTSGPPLSASPKSWNIGEYDEASRRDSCRPVGR